MTAGLEADLHVTPSHKNADMKLSLEDRIRITAPWAKCTEHEEPTASRELITYREDVLVNYAHCLEHRLLLVVQADSGCDVLWSILLFIAC